MKDIVVIGAGVTGLSTALALEARGYQPILANSSTVASVSSSAAGMIIGGEIDNYTRVSHAHGSDFAASLWKFGHLGFESLLHFCDEHSVRFYRGNKYRLITSDPELTEAALAVKQLNAAGFTTSLTRRTDANKSTPAALWAGLSDRILAVQDEGSSGAWLDHLGLLDTLNKLVKAPRHKSVKKLTSRGSSVDLLLEDGQHLQAELVVLACHLEIGTLLPAIRPALVSVADQWGQFNLGSNEGAQEWAAPGTVFSANHTYEWGVMTGPKALNMGGGRYLRPMAGIEATKAVSEPKITEHLLGQLKKTFPWAREAVPSPIGGAGLDCRPCDELPIIGPMYGDERLLLATGFMGSGLTQGFLAGRCLADLIATGQSQDLPRRLWPERLRSLPT